MSTKSRWWGEGAPKKSRTVVFQWLFPIYFRNHNLNGSSVPAFSGASDCGLNMMFCLGVWLESIGLVGG